MAKRSPILGYNHNVRYRGLVFHVQTEDSGVLSPHLFTHLFHHGVIVSTRKLVYDSGSAEDSIKSLMQAQHKAVLKDLKHGTFDDKIDQYLGGTPGLLPRDARDAPADEIDLEPTDPDRVHLARATSPDVSSPPILAEPGVGASLTEAELMLSREPTIEHPSISVRPTEPSVVEPAAGRTQTAERTSGATAIRNNLPTEDALEIPSDLRIDSSPEIMIKLELEEPELELELEIDEAEGEPETLPAAVAKTRTRRSRDTEVATSAPLEDHSRPALEIAPSDGVPGVVGAGGTLRSLGELSAPLVGATERMGPDTGPLTESSRGRRASTAVGAASLPPARPITRPPNRPSMSSPQVISRPLPPNERRSQETDAIEVYAPAPPSAELPGASIGGAGDRPGQYSQHKRSERIPTDMAREARRTPGPGIPVPAGATRPSRPGPAPGVAPSPRAATPPPIPPARVSEQMRGADQTRPEQTPRGAEQSRPEQVARGADQTRPEQVARGADQTRPEQTPRGAEQAPLRTPTPPRVANPSSSRTPSSGQGSASSGVVMTRPAVIVGAPAKPTNVTQRIRKAREDEGRGFGQGLISEKSLDEVILAYLSEDADDK